MAKPGAETPKRLLTADGLPAVKKRQRFSKRESAALQAAFEAHVMECGYDLDEAYEKMRLGRERGKKHAPLALDWNEIARACPERSVQSCYDHVGRIVSQKGEGVTQGPWSPEECATLRRLLIEHGSDWRKIGNILGRHPELVRDKWRDERYAFTKRTGTWAQEERQQLRGLVEQQQQQEEDGGANGFTGISWNVIADQMGGTRDRTQCRKEWYQVMDPSKHSVREEWSLNDDISLLDKVQDQLQQGSEDETELNWQICASDTKWKNWQVQSRFKRLKKLIIGSDRLSLGEVVEKLQLRAQRSKANWEERQREVQEFQAAIAAASGKRKVESLQLKAEEDPESL